MNKVKDVKKFLDNSLLMSQIHDCHVFRFHRFEGNIVIDVKEYSNSPWRRLEGNLISEITNQEISYVIPNYDSLKPFESSINRVIDDKIIEANIAAKIQQEINSIKNDMNPSWTFESFDKFNQRPMIISDVVTPLILNSTEVTFLPRVPVIKAKRVCVSKKHVYVGDLLVFMSRGLIPSGYREKNMAP